MTTELRRRRSFGGRGFGTTTNGCLVGNTTGVGVGCGCDFALAEATSDESAATVRMEVPSPRNARMIRTEATGGLIPAAPVDHPHKIRLRC
ncbi:MAG TPA: hypothetical protein VMA36_03735 [Candidatus Limnocylindria bacterium]|nr:hypothetical protein [Candidatus Limnocylindria bacterium]